MDIQFRCPSTSNFNQQTGTYQACNQLLQASNENVGLKVRCPRCNQLTVVPSSERVGARAFADGGIDTTEQKESVAQVQSTLSYGTFNKRVHCPKCGNKLSEDKKCPACRYEAPIVPSAKTPIEKIKVKPAGFQLWFRNIMTDGIGPTVFAVGMHSFVALILIISAIFAVISGGGGSVIIIICIAIVACIYLLLVFQTKRLGTKPGARLPFYIKPAWLLILEIARKQKWVKYDSKLANRIIIDVREEAFGDRDLLALDQLNIAEVLDAEGTALTDNALAAMHGLKHLRCLVLRKTHVTHEAVCRLQQSIPQCWIWY